jgi:hypothetical protein
MKTRKQQKAQLVYIEDEQSALSRLISRISLTFMIIGMGTIAYLGVKATEIVLSML